MTMLVNAIWTVFDAIKRAVMWAYSYRWWQVALLMLCVLYCVLYVLLALISHVFSIK